MSDEDEETLENSWAVLGHTPVNSPEPPARSCRRVAPPIPAAPKPTPTTVVWRYLREGAQTFDMDHLYDILLLTIAVILTVGSTWILYEMIHANGKVLSCYIQKDVGKYVIYADVDWRLDTSLATEDTVDKAIETKNKLCSH